MANHTILISKSGKEIPIADSGAPIKDEEGNIAGVVLVFRDITELRQAERKIKEYSDQLTLILDNIPGLIFYKDINNNFIRVNRALADGHNMTKEDLAGKSLFDLYPHDEAQAYWDDDLEVIKSGKPKLDIEEPWDTPEGRRWLNTSKIPLKDKKGEIYGIIGFSFDISELKKALSELKESEQRYKAQFEEAFDAIFLADPETGIIFDCNKAATELVRRDKSDIIGKHQKTIHPPERIKIGFSETFTKHLHKKRGQVLEARVITKNGDLKDVAITSSLIEIKGKTLMQGIFRDITQQKLAEEALKESEGIMRSILANSPDYILMVDKNCKIQFINRELFGEKMDDIVNRKISDLIQPEYQKIVENGIDQIFSKGNAENIKVTLLNQMGTKSVYEIRFGFNKSNRETIAAILILTDNTEKSHK